MNYIELFGPIKVKKFAGGGTNNWWGNGSFEDALEKHQQKRMAQITRESDLDEEEDLSKLPSAEDDQKIIQQEMRSAGMTQAQLNQEKADLIKRGVMSQPENSQNQVPTEQASGISDKTASGLSTGMQAVSQAVNGVDKALMGNKNFGGQSEAVDAVVHGTSSALMKSGNPYLQAAGAALEVANFATKATGDSVAGFDVDINSSGYGNMGHKDQKSNRDWGAAIGLGGLFGKDKVEAQIAQRNREMQMALKAANIAEDVKFEQEARANSVEDVIQENQIALQGGIDTSLLVARQGGKIIRKAQDGAKLEDIKVSKEENVLPTGELHKNKHDLDLDNITEKGIPVVVVDDDSAETFEEVKAQEDSVQQQAEVEALEIIFNKELTDYLEENHKKVKDLENPEELLIEVGKRLTKEILQNTKDNDGLIEKIEEKENGAES